MLLGPPEPPEVQDLYRGLRPPSALPRTSVLNISIEQAKPMTVYVTTFHLLRSEFHSVMELDLFLRSAVGMASHVTEYVILKFSLQV